MLVVVLKQDWSIFLIYSVPLIIESYFHHFYSAAEIAQLGER